MTHPQLRAALLMTALLTVTACTKPTDNPIDSLMGKRAETRARLTAAADDAVASGKTVEALALYERLYETRPGRKDIALTYAQLLRKTGNPDKALRVLSRFSGSGDPQIRNELAAAHIAVGNFTTAEALLSGVLADPAARAYEADAASLMGIVLDARGNHAEAERMFRRALDGWRGDPTPVMNNLGLSLAAQGRFDEALDVLRKALVISKNDKQEIARNIALISDLRATVVVKAPVQIVKKATVVKKKKAAPKKSPACTPCPVPPALAPVKQ